MSLPLQSSSPSRLTAIEGLRAYLALWVVLSHAMQWSGMAEAGLTGLWAWAWQGSLAVKVFIIISGFVIFHRLEEKRESTRVFLLHRFFRIYPVYILLFLLSVPLSSASFWQALTPAAQIAQLQPTYPDWPGHTAVHVVLHIFMLHGLPPEWLVPAAPYAFLPPAWSIALEFQFYLLAPLIYALAVSGTARARAWLYGLCVLLLLVASKPLYALLNPLALPFYWPYFLVGILSFFSYRHLRGRIGWPLLACVALALFKVSGRSVNLFPVCAWLVFFGLLLETPASRTARVLLPVFDHRVIQYLGRISYSIYLSHWPVLVGVHLALARFGFLPGDRGHLALLLAVALPLTLAVSAILYHTIEKPGIALGRKLGGRIISLRQSAPVRAKAVPENASL